MKILLCLATIPAILLGATTSTTVTVSTSANPSVYGSAVTLTATVTPSTATGLVTFYDGVTVLGTASLASGQATMSTVLLASGSLSLKAYYEGDSADSPSASTAVAQTVLPIGSGGLSAAVNYPAGSQPFGIAVADFNLDGRVDIAVADNSGSSTGGVSVLLGNGDGTFQSALSASAGASPYSLAAADFNGDGKPDLAVISAAGAAILLGKGDGTFQNPVSYAAGSVAQYVAVGDFNQDGKPDLVVANYTSAGGASVLLGNGDGTFQSPVALATSISYASFVAVADFNLDGKPDVAVASSSETNVFLGNGDGTFQAPSTYTNFGTGAVADFNGDGKPDLAGIDGQVAFVALGNGDGTFQSPMSAADYYDYYTGILTEGDFNGDGKPDLAATDGDGVMVLLGHGDGTFAAGTAYSTGGNYSYFLATADFNGDGRADIAASELYSSQTGVLLGLSAGIQDLTVSKSHSGHFTPGQTGATWTITVSNVGGNYTSGTVSMVDTLPAGVTATAIGGTGWSCVLTTVTCTRSDTLLSFVSYPPITLTVNVASNAALLITNTATVSGGGETNTANDTASDPTYVSTAATPSISSITNPADDSTGYLAPGAIATVTGTALASATAQASPPLPTTLANVNVTVNGILAPIELVSPGQINFQIPYEVPTNQYVSVIVSNEQAVSAPASLTIYPDSPHIFAGTIQDANTGTNSATNPAVPGSAITVFFTGAGAVTPAVADGAAAPSSPPAIPTSTFSAQIGNSGAVVSSVMLTPGLAGVAQANVTIPTGLEAGSYPLYISSSPSATVFVGGPAPAIAFLLPNNLPAGTGETEIAINGSNFGETPSVSFTAPGGQVTALSIENNETSQLFVYLPANLLATAGVAQITTANSLGVSSNSLPFYVTPFPVSAVSPNRATAGSAATQVTVTGQSLGTATSLSFTPPGGSPTSISLSQIQSTQVQATIPATLLKSAGTAQIAVANSAGALSNPLLFTIVPSLPTTTTSLTTSVNPSEFGHSVTLTATVTPSTATGNITFLDGTTILETAPLTSGQATLTTTLLPADGQSLKAFYGGDANDAPSLSAAVTQTVNALPDSNGFAAPLYASVAGEYGAYSAAVGDFNKDGIPDLAVRGWANADNLSILLGNGDGTFQTPVGYNAGYIVDAIAVGDFNGDGIPDVVAADENESFAPMLSVFFGNGDGTFQAPINSTALVSDPEVMVVADFNGDGKADLAMAASDNIVVLLGNGDGTFQTPLESSAASEYGCVAQIAVGDFNGDGNPDLAGWCDDGYSGVTVLLGNGDGTFQPGTVVASGVIPNGVLAADFNNDGKTDLAVAGYESVTVLLAAANGGVQAAVNYAITYSDNNWLIGGDFNGDGNPDLLLGNGQVLYGNGDGTFQPAATLNGVIGGSPVVADFNGDGRPDLASVANGLQLAILLGVPKAPDLSITNTNATVFVEGQTGAAYTITVTNTGSATTTGEVTVTDALPTGLTATNIAGTGWTCTLATLTCTRSDALAVSASWPAITLTVDVAANAPAIVTNVASVSGGGETNTANDTASVNTTISNETFQSITFGALSNVTYGAAPFTVSATASSGLAVTFTSGSSSVCTVSGATITLVGGGMCAITAAQAGNATYAAATPVTQTFTVNPEAQTILFNALSAITLPASPFVLTATASSGLGVSYVSTTTGVCTVTGATLTPVSAGMCSITASQAGNANYAAATSVTQSFTINPAPSSGGGGNGGGGSPGGGGGTVSNTLTSSPASISLSGPAMGPAISQSVTLTYTTSYEGAPSFSGTVTMNQGSAWLTYSPATINMTQASFNGSVYTYTATITVTVNPISPTTGTYTGAIGFSVYGTTLSLPVTMKETTQAQYTISPQSLSFAYQAGAANVPATQSVSIFSQPSGLSFSASLPSNNGNWLSVSNASGQTPGSVGVSVNVGGLAAGTYKGTVAITSGAESTFVPVTLTVTAAAAPQLSVSPPMQTFSLAQGSTSATGQVVVSNNGGGTLQFIAQAATDQGSWLALTGSGTGSVSGSATPGSPASLPFTVNPSGLGPGVYSGTITATGGGYKGSSTVILTVVSSEESIQLSQTGMSFTAVAGGAQPPSQSFLVSANGSRALDWSATSQQVSNPLSEKTWLQISPKAGEAPDGQPGTPVTVSVNTSTLPAGQYYGSVNIAATGATNTPQVVTVALNVLASSASPGETMSTGAVLLSGAAGSTIPLLQTVTIFNPSASSTSYSSSTFTANGANWLSVSPASGTAVSGETSIAIAANLDNLAPGLQSGTVQMIFGDGSSATIQVFVLATGSAVSNASGIAAKLRPAAVATACAGGKASFLIPVFLLPAAQSVVPAAMPATVQVQIVDDCGNPVTAANGGSVQVAFSDGDAGLNLQDAGGGVWQATWTPVNAASQVTLQVVASEGALLVNPTVGLATTTVTVTAVNANSPPQPTGIANAASGAQAIPEVVAPGSYVAIYGTGLGGSGSPSATTLPLPTTLNGVQVSLGGISMPLLYAGAGQVNAIVPQELAPNASYPLVVVRGSAQSAPVPLTVTELQPGVYTLNAAGSGQGIVTNATTGQIVNASNPAHAGDYLTIYCTGLGALTGSNGQTEPADGAEAPTTTLFQTTATVTATIGGTSAPVSFAGLTPTLAALYQVNVQVPAAAPTGDSVAVVITATDATTGTVAQSNPVTIAVQ